MSMAVKLRRAPGRIAAGTFILNSGLSKLKVGEDTAIEIHKMAAGAYPVVGRLGPKTFVRGLGVTEVAVGGALLLPIAPPALAGAGLAAFSGALLGLYWRTPGLHPAGDPRPTPQGIPLAKDAWLAGIAAGLILDSLVPDFQARRALHRAEREARKADVRAERADTKLEQFTGRRKAREQRKQVARAQAKRVRAQAKKVRAQANAATENVRTAAGTAQELLASAAAETAASVRHAEHAVGS